MLHAVVLATLVGGTRGASNDRNVADATDVLATERITRAQTADAETGGSICGTSCITLRRLNGG